MTKVARHQRNYVWDETVLKFFHSSTTWWLDRIMIFIARSGRVDVVVVFGVLSVLTLKRNRRMCDALFITLAVFGVVVINLLVRNVLQGQFESWRTPNFDFGFPSSQAADSLAIVLASGILAWRTRWRWPIIVFGAFYVLSVGLSRVYLAGHYPSDILAGWALALVWVTAVSPVRWISTKVSA